VNTLTVSALSAGYGRFDVVRDVSFGVAPGEAIALLGPNGAGKTTVLRSIMGMTRHRRGSITVNGTELIGMATHEIARGHAGLVAEGRRLFTDQTVEDNLILGGLRLRRDKARVQALLESVYELFPALRSYRGRLAAALSGGEQQMVAIGRMMMSDPDVMLLDEPSLGLAPLVIDAIGNALRLLREQGHSLLLVEQRVDLALTVCDRLYVMSGGVIVRESRCADVDPEGKALIDAYLG
jgi:branched-chain amino acid transport system ATP-binding protein